MNKEKTVFILGAGASKTYGFPLGEELRRVIVSEYSNHSARVAKTIKFDNFETSTKSFQKHFEMSGDKSIDLFLSKFNQHSEVGIIAILHSILIKEDRNKFLDNLFYNYRDRNELKLLDDWMWYLYDRLTKNLNSARTFRDIDFSNISFVTFNYDRCLEHFFYERLSNGFNFGKIGGSAKEIMQTLKIEHVYGKVCPLPWQDDKADTLEYGIFNSERNSLSLFTKNINLIGQRASGNKDNISQIIRDADKIFFLGFGFDENNLEVLGFPNILSPEQKIYGTGFGLYKEELDKIESFFWQKEKGGDGVSQGNVKILNTNCTTLLRMFFDKSLDDSEVNKVN